jgi:hypothetical protein
MRLRSTFDQFHPVTVEFRDLLRRVVPKMGADRRISGKENAIYGRCRSDLRYGLYSFLYPNNPKFLDDYINLEAIRSEVIRCEYTQTERYARFVKPAEDLADTLAVALSNADFRLRESIATNAATQPKLGNPSLELTDSLHALRAACVRIVKSERVQQHDSLVYDEIRSSVAAIDSNWLPRSVRTQPSAGLLRRDALEGAADAQTAAENIDREFELMFAQFGERDAGESEPSAAVPPALPERQPRTIAERVVAIRKFAPIAFDAVGELVTLHERRLHNQIPNAEQLRALDLLRALHAEIGALIQAVEARRGITQRINRLVRLSGRVFQLPRDTGELIVAGTPAITASLGASFAAMMALDLIFGVEVGTTEATAAVTVTGGIFGAHSVAKEMNRRRTK